MYSELFITEDGSHTLFVPTIDECYHSTHGAVQESQHIFINSGFKQCDKSEIRVLEIGFGTGLNTFLTLMEAEKTGKKVYYTSLEKYYRKAGFQFSSQGSRVIRHAFATRLVEKRTPIKAIADLLGHKWIDTTFIYIKVDVEGLRVLAREWPEVVQ